MSLFSFFLSFLAALVHQWIKEARVAFDGRKFFVRCFCLPFLHCVLKLFLTEGSSSSIAFSNSFSSRHFTQKDNTSEGRLYNREKILLENGFMRSTTVQVVCNISRLLFLFQMAIPFNLCGVFNLLTPQGALRGPAFHTGSSQSVHPSFSFWVHRCDGIFWTTCWSNFVEILSLFPRWPVRSICLDDLESPPLITHLSKVHLEPNPALGEQIYVTS